MLSKCEFKAEDTRYNKKLRPQHEHPWSTISAYAIVIYIVLMTILSKPTFQRAELCAFNVRILGSRHPLYKKLAVATRTPLDHNLCVFNCYIHGVVDNPFQTSVSTSRVLCLQNSNPRLKTLVDKKLTVARRTPVDQPLGEHPLTRMHSVGGPRWRSWDMFCLGM